MTLKRESLSPSFGSSFWPVLGSPSAHIPSFLLLLPKATNMLTLWTVRTWLFHHHRLLRPRHPTRPNFHNGLCSLQLQSVLLQARLLRLILVTTLIQVSAMLLHNPLIFTEILFPLTITKSITTRRIFNAQTLPSFSQRLHSFLDYNTIFLIRWSLQRLLKKVTVPT